MELDNNFLQQLIEPLKGSVGLQPSKYFKALAALGVAVENSQGVADEKFISHFRHLISAGAITNNQNSKELKDFGIGIGLNRHITFWDSASPTIKIGHTPAPPIQTTVNNTINVGSSFNGNLQAGQTNIINEPQKTTVWQWLLNNIVGVVIAGLILAILTAWFGLG